MKASVKVVAPRPRTNGWVVARCVDRPRAEPVRVFDGKLPQGRKYYFRDLTDEFTAHRIAADLNNRGNSYMSWHLR